MISNESKNIKLDHEQLEKVYETKRILTGLEKETTKASVVLKGMKIETGQAIKDKEYQMELLVDIEQRVKDAKIEEEKTSIEVSQNNKTLLQIKEESGKILEQNEEKIMELNKREEKTSSKELEIKDRLEQAEIREDDVKRERILVERAKKVITEAIKTVTWR